MTKKERFEAFVTYFSESYPQPETELQYSNPFELLVAVVLSAQCTDARINKVTPALFRDFPTPEHMAASHFDELFPYIRSVSYPNNKTKHLLALSKRLVEEFNSEIPNTIQDLTSLQGVGRKTA
ncbi:endonuclease III domain-containing protein, partial [Ekhidna sp.]